MVGRTEGEVTLADSLMPVNRDIHVARRWLAEQEVSIPEPSRA